MAARGVTVLPLWITAAMASHAPQLIAVNQHRCATCLVGAIYTQRVHASCPASALCGVSPDASGTPRPSLKRSRLLR